MPRAEYFRRQAETCLRLARVCRDEDATRRLLALADEYHAKAQATEMDDAPLSTPPRANEQGDTPGGGDGPGLERAGLAGSRRLKNGKTRIAKRPD